MQEILSSGFANKKQTDQPVHSHRLVCAFDIHVLESIISKIATIDISIFWLVFVAEETGLDLVLLKAPKTDFVPLGPI